MAKSKFTINNPNKILLFRCSTGGQNFESQKTIMDGYFDRHGIDCSNFSVAEEYEHGDVSYHKRIIKEVITKSGSGSIIYVSELSRLSREFRDIYDIVNFCADKGIMIIQTKDGTQIENESIGGKAILFALGLAAGIELDNIRDRNRAGMDNYRENIKNGGHTTKSGKVRTHMGNAKGCNMDKARESSHASRAISDQVWWNQSQLIELIKTLWELDTSDREILRICQEKYAKSPEIYGTRKGKALKRTNLYDIKIKLLSEN